MIIFIIITRDHPKKILTNVTYFQISEHTWSKIISFSLRYTVSNAPLDSDSGIMDTRSNPDRRRYHVFDAEILFENAMLKVLVPVSILEKADHYRDFLRVKIIGIPNLNTAGYVPVTILQ
jgi:hypothetical protein